MGIMRWAVYNRLKEKRPNTTLTYGYLKKTPASKPAGKNPTSTMPGIAANLEDIRTDEQYRSAFSKRRQEEEQPGTAYRQRVFPLGVDYRKTPDLFLAAEPAVISIFDSWTASECQP